MNWTPIDLQKNKLQRTSMAWSESTTQCYETNKDCTNCPNLKVTESLRPWHTEDSKVSNWGVNENKPVACKVPITVQKLLNRGILPHERSYYSGRK